MPVFVSCENNVSKNIFFCFFLDEGDKTLTDEQVALTVDVNVRGLMLCTRYAISNMKKRNVDGHIVNINRYFFYRKIFLEIV